jgi:ABC-type multidrug transport system fused ATPase/permease subunit
MTFLKNILSLLTPREKRRGALVLISAVFRMGTIYVMNRYVEMRRHALSERLLETYLRQPYAFFLDRHSGDMASNILSEVDQMVLQVFRPLLFATTHGFVLLALITVLVLVDPMLALGMAAVLGSIYGAIYLVVRLILGRIGKDRVLANTERFRIANEALSGIKLIKLMGAERGYL